MGRSGRALIATSGWRRARHAIEFRHPSWFTREVAGCLRAVTYASGYAQAALGEWARKIRRWLREGRNVHVYIDNDAWGHAPRGALRLLAMLRRAPRGKARRRAA